MTLSDQMEMMKLSFEAATEADFWAAEYEGKTAFWATDDRSTGKRMSVIRRKAFLEGFNRCLAHLAARQRLVLSDPSQKKGCPDAP